MITKEEFDKLEGWFWYDEAEVMRDAIEHLKKVNGVIFEAGSYKGKSTAAIASCTKDKIYAVDPFTWDGGTLEKFKEQTRQYDNIICIQDDAVNYRESFNESIKLLFIDCDHSYELTKKIYELYEPLVIPGGIILFHDCSPLLHDLKHIKNEDSNQLINTNNFFGGWIGPTQVLQEVRKKHRKWVEGARSIHGILKEKNI